MCFFDRAKASQIIKSELGFPWFCGDTQYCRARPVLLDLGICLSSRDIVCNYCHYNIPKSCRYWWWWWLSLVVGLGSYVFRSTATSHNTIDGLLGSLRVGLMARVV